MIRSGMFLIYLLTAYLIPGIYAYLRIYFLLVPAEKKLMYTFFFILLIAAFPLTEILMHEEIPRVFMPLLRFGFYTMPYMLYLFLLVLIFDSFLLINLAFGWIPRNFYKSQGFKKYGRMVAILVPALVVIFGIWHFNHIRITTYHVEVPAANSSKRDLRVAFASDLHVSDLTTLNFVERFVKKLLETRADIILFGGDMLEGDRNIRTVKIENLIRSLNPVYGVYGVFGNHEYHRYEKSLSFYEQSGITILRDTLILIDSSFYLAGRKDIRNRDREPVEVLTGKIRHDLPVILLDHRPVNLHAVSQSRVNVQFSGHTHHGQLFPFNWITRHLYELSWGHKNINGTHFFVSSGIQLWGPPVRTTGKSEIIVVEIKFRH